MQTSPLLLAFLIPISMFGYVVLSANAFARELDEPPPLLARLVVAFPDSYDKSRSPFWSHLETAIALVAGFFLSLGAGSTALDPQFPAFPFRLIFLASFAVWAFWTAYLAICLARSIRRHRTGH